MNCDYKGCKARATTRGFIYGHVRGNNEGDKFIPVNACDLHKKIDGFFPEKQEERDSFEVVSEVSDHK